MPYRRSTRKKRDSNSHGAGRPISAKRSRRDRRIRRPYRQNHRRRPAGRVLQRRRCAALRGKRATRPGAIKSRHDGVRCDDRHSLHAVARGTVTPARVTAAVRPGQIPAESPLIWKGRRCEACSHPDRNPGCGDRRKLAHHPAERVDRPLFSLNSLRLATDFVLLGQVAILCRRPALPRRAGDIFSTAHVFPAAARRHPPESRHPSASPGAASPLNRPACPVRPRPPILAARPPPRRASPGWRPPGAFH